MLYPNGHFGMKGSYFEEKFNRMAMRKLGKLVISIECKGNKKYQLDIDKPIQSSQTSTK